MTIGIDPSTLLSSNILTLSIDEGGDGGDGYAVDFLTVGVVTADAGPEVSRTRSARAVRRRPRRLASSRAGAERLSPFDLTGRRYPQPRPLRRPAVSFSTVICVVSETTDARTFTPSALPPPP